MIVCILSGANIFNRCNSYVTDKKLSDTEYI
jgi:hypothetical protein